METIASNKDSVDVTSQERSLGEDFECEDETRRKALEYFVKAMDLLELSKVECARRSLQSALRYLLALTPESFRNPTVYEKQQVRRGKEMSLWCVSGPPWCGVILLDHMDSNQNLYTNFTIAFGALACRLHEHNMAIEVFKLPINSNGTDCSPLCESEEDLEFSVVVAKANIGCVFLILRQLEKAKEYLECALKSLERFKWEKSIVTLEEDIFAVENNLSLVLQGQHNFPAATKLQNDLVCKAKHLRLPFRMVAAMHYNRAELSLELEDPVKALKELQQLKSSSEILDDQNGIPEEFISSKICLVYLLMNEVAFAEEIAVKSSLSRLLSLFLPSKSSSWLPFSSSSLSLSSLSSSPLSTSSSSLSSSSSSPPSSPSSSSTSSSSSFEFEVLPKSNRNLPWDFSVATFANLVDFHLYQENVEPVSAVLDLCVSNCKEMFGKSHPTIASLLYRQGVKFSLTGENVSSKNCFEEALSIYTRSGFALSHPEVSKCNAALARVLLCETFQEEIILSSQSIERTQSDSDEHCRKSQEFIFSDSIASSSMFEKFVKQIIKSEEKFGEISELVMTKNLLRIQGPSVGQITVWLQDRSMKITTQPTHGKKSLVANHEESLPCNCVDIDEALVEEMKMCASSLGLAFETCTERPSCPSPIQIPGLPLMNPKQTPNVKAMIGASHDGQDSFDDEESASQAKPKRNPASDQSRHESRCSPVTLNGDNGQASKNRAQQVIGTHEDPTVKPCVIDDRLENVAEDVTDGVATFQVSSSEGITFEQDHNEELGRKLQTSNQKSHGNGKAVKIERSAKQDGVKGMEISRNERERRGLAHRKENYANNSFYRGEVVAEGNGDGDVEVRGACDYQNNQHLQDSDIPKEGDSERGSKKKCKERLGLKGGRRDDFPFNHSSLGAAKIPCTSETSQLGIKSGFLARHSNGNSMACSMDETEGRINCTNICQFSDCGECSSSDTATASITALTSPDQSFFNFNGYQLEKSSSLPYKSKYRSPKNQPSLPNSDSATDSLATLEKRVAESCSLVERVLKEREEKDKVINEEEREQRKERSRGELQQQERSERKPWETMQRNANREGTSTGSEEEAPSQHTTSPEKSQWLCEHYQRLCRVKFPCCGRFYPCHRCHNNSEECEKDNCKANEAFYMECSVCSHQQAINKDSHTCAECMTRMSKYFCSICKHFSGADKNPYHCTKCGICRIHKDKSFHCDVCNVCLDKRLQGKHNCRPDSGHDECCICLESEWKSPCGSDAAISSTHWSLICTVCESI